MLEEIIGQTIAEKYKIEEELRDSGLGKIYRGTHLLMNKPVTIKILSPALAVDENIVKRFSDEARTVSHLSHPNILNVTDFGTDKNGFVYIILEDSEGESLKGAIEHRKTFSPAHAVRVAQQITAALSTAHNHDVIHGNLNTENVLLARTAGESEIVKILEFGSFKPEINEFSIDEEPEAEKFPENIEYLSPEQCSGAVEADERSDIYSTGIILYEMLAGEVPFTADEPTDLMLKHAEEIPQPLSAFRDDLPADIEPIIIKALAKNPEMRYQTAQEMALELNQVSKGFDDPDAVIVPQIAAAKAAGDSSSGKLWKTVFASILGMAVLAAGLIYGTSVKQTEPQMVLQTDSDGKPVQPLGPPTGLSEQSFSRMDGSMPPMYDVPNLNDIPVSVGGSTTSSDGYGDGYDPWARGGAPPAGAPVYPSTGGQIITIDPNNPNGSIFMPQDGIVLVPVPADQQNSNTNPKAQPSPGKSPKEAKTPADAQAQPSPQATPAQTDAKQAQPKTEKPAQPKKEKPAEKTNEKPASPASSVKPNPSGKEQDAN